MDILSRNILLEHALKNGCETNLILKLKIIKMTLVKVNNSFSKTIDGMMKEFMNEFPAAVNKTVREDLLHFPPVNIFETDGAYHLEFAAPGFEKTDFNVKLDGKILTVGAEKKTAEAEQAPKLIRREFSQKSFRRSFTLDEKIDAAQIQGKYENGILLLELPKKEEAKPDSKQIEIL